MDSLPSPSRRSLIQILLLAWQVSRTAARRLVWETVREGSIDLRSQGRVVRVLTIGGLALIGAFLLSLLYGDLLRQNSPLDLLSNDSTATRALLVPALATPITYAAVALGWGYLLAGGLHARRLVRWGIFIAYLICGVSPLTFALNPETAGGLALVAAALLLALIACFLILPRVALPLALEWCLVLALHAGLTVTSMLAAGRLQGVTQEGWLNNQLSGVVQITFLLIVPFLVIAGLGWVDFGIEVSGWAAREARRALDAPWAGVLLLALLGARLAGHLVSLAGAEIDAGQWRAWAGAGLLCAGLLPVMLLRRTPASRGVSQRFLLALAVAIPMFQIVIVVLLQATAVVLLLGSITPDLATTQNQIYAVLLSGSDLVQRYRGLGVALLALVVALVGWRRGHPAMASFGGVLAWSALVGWLTGEGQALAAWRFEYADVDMLLLAAITAAALLRLARRELTEERALRLLAVAILLALLNQTDFLDNPFSPLFSFAGVFFLLFGIVWNILTASGGFVNHETPGLSRDSRALLYIGYVLLSVSVSHWYLVSHNLAMQDTQASMNQVGFTIVGLPIAYLMLVERGHLLVEEGEGEG